MGTKSGPGGSPFDLLPDSLLDSIIRKATAASTVPVGVEIDRELVPRGNLSDLKEIARVRTVCKRFNQSTLQAEEIFCRLDVAGTMDARILFFLHSARHVRGLHLVCDSPPGLKRYLLSSSFVAGLIHAAPRVERFSLMNIDLGDPFKPDELVQQVFQALSKCPLLRVIFMDVNCKVLLRRPLSLATPFLKLKELQLGNLDLITVSTVEDLIYRNAPCLERLRLVGRIEPGKLRIKSSTLHTLQLEFGASELEELEIEAPHLRRLTLSESLETRINAPGLSILNFDYPPTGPIIGAQKWKVRELSFSGDWYESVLFQVLDSSSDLAVVDMLELDNATEFEQTDVFLSKLRGVGELGLGPEVLDSMVDLTCMPDLENLTRLRTKVYTEQQLTACLNFVKASSNLIYLGMDMQDFGDGILLSSFLELKDEKPRLKIVLDEPGAWVSRDS